MAAVPTENEIIDQALIEPNLASYEQFFDHVWCKYIFGLVESSPLKDAVDTLMVAWRSTNGVHMLPWLLVDSLRSFADGEYKGRLHFRAGYSDTVVKFIREKLENRMPSLDFNQRTELRRALTKLENEAFEVFKTVQSQVKFDVAEYWDFITHTPEFRFCILGTQRIDYGSLFFAYEDFLANTIRTKERDYSSRGDPIKDAFATHFGKSLCESCWTHDEVDLASALGTRWPTMGDVLGLLLTSTGRDSWTRPGRPLHHCGAKCSTLWTARYRLPHAIQDIYSAS